MKYQMREWNRRSLTATAGFAMLASALSGCGFTAQAESQPREPEAAGSAGSSNDDRAAYESRYDELHAQNPELYPTRVSRGLLEGNLEGKVTFSQLGGAPMELTSRVAWEEEAPTAPAPRGEYLADFREFQGCAVYENLGGAKLCFDIAPDVATLDLSEKRMRTAGIQELLVDHSGCIVALQDVKLLDAKKAGEGFDVYYIAQVKAEAGCDVATGPISIQMSVRQL